jgi:hypothetical protein
MSATKNATLIGEKDLYTLSSVTWQKPGKITIKISCVREGTVGAGMPGLPVVKDYFEIPIALRFERSLQRFEGGVMYCEWEFEGGSGDLSSPTDRNPDKLQRGEQWGMSVDMMQVPLAAHPDASTIMKSYGGLIKGGEIVFGRYFNNKKNPYYGQSGFYFPTVTLEVQCIMPALSVVSFSQVDQVGRNDADLTSPNGKKSGFGFESVTAPTGRKPWILAAHTVRQVGNERQETKSWRWGGIPGWVDPIYDPDWKHDAKAATPAKNAIPVGGG